MKDINKFFLFALLFVLVILGIQFVYSGNYFVNMMDSDFGFHFAKARGEQFEYGENANAVDEYAPMVSWLSMPFGFNTKSFWNFYLFILCFVTPLILYFLSKKWWIVIVYYSTGYFWWMEQGMIAQSLANLVILGFIWQKNVFVRLLLVWLGVLVHSWLFFALILIWVVDLCIDFGKEKILLGVSCFGNQNGVLQKVRNELAVENSTSSGGHVFTFTLTKLLWFLSLQFCFIFWYWVVKAGIKNIRLFLFSLLFLAAGFFDPRVWLSGILLWLILLVKGVSDSCRKSKIIFWFVVVFMIFFNFVFWLSS